MTAISTLPATTLKLLCAIRSTVGVSEKTNVRRVVIWPDGRSGGIDYLPVKSKFTSAAIAKAGISELVARYSFQRTRAAVAEHFRPGVYDVSGREIIVVE